MFPHGFRGQNWGAARPGTLRGAIHCLRLRTGPGLRGFLTSKSLWPPRRWGCSSIPQREPPQPVWSSMSVFSTTFILHFISLRDWSSYSFRGWWFLQNHGSVHKPFIEHQYPISWKAIKKHVLVLSPNIDVDSSPSLFSSWFPMTNEPGVVPPITASSLRIREKKWLWKQAVKAPVKVYFFKKLNTVTKYYVIQTRFL